MFGYQHRASRALGALAIAWSFAIPSLGRAEAPVAVRGGETVTIDGVRSILIRAPHPKGSVILLTGGDGRLEVGSGARFGKAGDNVLIRNRDAFVMQGYNVLLAELGTNLSAAVDHMAALKRPVIVIATSKGTQRAAQGIVEGAMPDRLVLTSGFLSKASGPDDSVQTILVTPNRLPRTLALHHREDRCRWTQPAGVAPFKAWAGGRVQVEWMSGGQADEANPCRFSAHHGFAGQDEEFVARIVKFMMR
ncbi:alpha/beta hydrolase [Bosea sp. Root483D1]|uniref:alpha/beta hydrolase n=1 Tax=Bosea sp. Root483D1 TaxID=1736544 RepID=UPI000B30C80D|nr:alpha/beta hydrolase [Bosea sp. Root483D1]